MKRKIAFILVLVLLLIPVSAYANMPEGFYQPNEYADNDYFSADSRWCFERSAESPHFFVFWEPGFGADPANAPESMRVDIRELLQKSEQFYQTNIELGMVDALPYGNKIQIYLLYTDEWVATGSGFDNRIGAMWVSPSTCHPIGSVIAHEMGHCFQYLVYCSQLENGISDENHSGFRYGYAEGSGNALWEIGAQWQAWQDYPEEQFTDYELETWFTGFHRALENEFTRYQNYWWFNYLTEEYGRDAYGRIWRESEFPEDAYSCFLRLYLNGSLSAFYADLYQYASHAVTFDFDVSRTYADTWQGRYNSTLYPADGWQRIAYKDCPEANGFAAIRLNSESALVTVRFRGLPAGSSLAEDDPGRYLVDDGSSENQQTIETRTYNYMSAAPGWRWGFAALCGDGTRVYSQMHSESEGEATFEIPENVQELYLVVLGAPEEYVCHVWDNDESTDAQLPFEIQIDYE